MKKTKINLLLICSFFIYGMIKGQSIKDYFISSGCEKLSEYYIGDSNSLFKAKILQKAISDSVYKIEKTLYYKEKPTNVEVRTVTITKYKIELTTDIYVNNIKKQKNEKKYNPPITWLIMPTAGHDTSWLYILNTDTIKCTALFIKVIINNDSKIAIKVTNQPFKDGKIVIDSINYDYYVEGIGFWKRKLHDGSDFQVLENQQAIQTQSKVQVDSINKITLNHTQTIKDYFIPSGGKNLSNYNWGSDVIKVKEWFVPIFDSVYRIDNVILFNDKISNAESRTVTIYKDRVEVSNVVYFNNVIHDDGEKTHNPPTVWLKMPLKGQTASWSFTPWLATTKCKSEWTTVTIDGVTKKAIKVTNQPFEDGKLLDFGITYDYYVEGIGYWKRKLEDGTDFQILKNQEYDSTYKIK